MLRHVVSFRMNLSMVKKVPSSKPTVQAIVNEKLKALLESDALKNENSLSQEVGKILERYKDPDHFLIRVPEKLRERLEKEAKSENRSVENLIEWILIRHYETL
jgi:hypothetical protein